MQTCILAFRIDSHNSYYHFDVLCAFGGYDDANRYRYKKMSIVYARGVILIFEYTRTADNIHLVLNISQTCVSNFSLRACTGRTVKNVNKTIGHCLFILNENLI